jgi:sarcosine oxidase subunit beta
MAKVIVCRCEDVTLGDIEHTLELGYTDIEEVKRYTGFGTGPCQGKECVWAVARIVGQKTGGEVPPFNTRPPLTPAPLKLFARVGEVLASAHPQEQKKQGK